MNVKLKVITVGDKTTTGGTVESGARTVFFHGRQTALIGSVSFCPQCKTPGIIRQTKSFNVFAESKQVCLEDDVVECGCPLGTNRLIASPGALEFIGYEDGTVGIPMPRMESNGFINRGNDDLFRPDEQEPEQYAQTARKKRTGVDAGFCVVPQQATTVSFENILFAGVQPAGTRELYRALNSPDKEYKAGSILLIVDPDKQDAEQIAHMKAAKQRIDTALEPLTYQEASFLHQHYATIANFSNIADKGIGLAADPVGKYFENIEKILKSIQETYKNTFLTRGALIGEQFYVRRSQLFNELDRVLKVGFLNKAMRFGEYTKIKNALGLSTRAITHKWNETGVGDIEGYATHIERAAKYVKTMRNAGYVGIAFSAIHSINEINEACSVGREDECTKKKYTEIGSFSAGLAGGLAGGAIGMGLCTLVLGTATMAAGGAGALACGVILGTSVGYVGGEISASGGEDMGEFIYSTVGY